MMAALSILSGEERRRINNASIEILESTGVKVGHREIFKLLCDAGAQGEEGKGVVHFPEKLVWKCLSGCPSSVKFSDLEGNTIDLTPGGKTIFWTGNALNVTNNGMTKGMDSKEFVKLVKVVDQLENVQGVVGTSLEDYPPQARDFVGFHLMAENTSKHLRPCIYTPLGTEIIIEMADVILNGRTLRDYPIFSIGYTIVSPLHWTRTALESFLKTSGYGIPVMVNSEPLTGATSPVTLAGSLVLANAEVLSGIVIVQILEKGRPCIHNTGFAHVLDMRKGNALNGAAENGLLAAAGAEMASFYNLPSASWMGTDSLVMDSQNSYEKMITGLLHTLGNVNIIWGIGQMESQLSISAEQAVIDNEIAGSILRAKEGIKVNEDTLALNLIKKMGFRSEYLTSEHTMKYYKEELSYPEMPNRDRRADWVKGGSKSLEEKTREKVREIIKKSNSKKYLTGSQREKLKKIEKKWLEKCSKI